MLRRKHPVVFRKEKDSSVGNIIISNDIISEGKIICRLQSIIIEQEKDTGMCTI